jgi:hypothetical protein
LDSSDDRSFLRARKLLQIKGEQASWIPWKAGA